MQMYTLKALATTIMFNGSLATICSMDPVCFMLTLNVL